MAEYVRHHGEDEEAFYSGGGKQWKPVRNLDSFCTKFYQYYVEKGFWCIIISRITYLINLAFTIFFSTFLLLFLDWHAVVECHKTSCSNLVRTDVFKSLSFGEVLVVFYFVIFSIFWLWSAIAFFTVFRNSWEMWVFYSEMLEIQDDEIPMLEWHEVLERLVKLQKTVRICIVKEQLDPLDITNRIMRKDNYMISMVNTGVFKVDTWLGEHSGVFGKSLEWNLRFCVLDSMFDEKFSVRGFLDPSSAESFSENLQIDEGISKLQRRMIVMGIINFILMPFIAIFMAIFFILKHFEEFHSRKSSLEPREWTGYAKWHLREYNELPHFFERRLRNSVEPSLKYIEQFPANLSMIVAQCVAYVSGAIVGVLLFLSLTGSRSILNVYVGDRSLIWYLAVFTAILAISRSMIPESVDKYNPHQAMAEVVKHTHYCPPHWKQRFHEVAVRNEFGQLFKPTVLIFLGEILSVVTTPFVLCCYMPRKAPKILHCVKQLTVYLGEGVGDVCGPAAFDLEKFSGIPGAYHVPEINEAKEAKDGKSQKKTHQEDVSGVRKYAESRMPFADKADLEDQYLEPFKSSQGKLEKSFVSFMVNHPYYQTNKNGAKLLVALNREVHADDVQSPTFRSANGNPLKGKGALTKPAADAGESKHRQEEFEAPMAASRLTLSQYMTADANRSINTHLDTIDQSVKNMTESDLLLRCSFSKILQDRNPIAPLSSTEKKNEETKLFAALESVYEKVAVEEEKDGFADEVSVELTRRV